MAKDKEKKADLTSGNEAWETVYNGHTVRVVYRHKSRLYIDGEEVAKEGGLGGHMHPTLSAQFPDSDEIVIAMIDASSNVEGLNCKLIIGKAVELSFGVALKSGDFHAYTKEELKKIKDEEEEATMAAVLNNVILH